MGDARGWLGIGLYTAAEAARLLKLAPATVRRWIGGYHYNHRGVPRYADPLWAAQLPKLSGQVGLGFLDLMQLRVVSAFVAEGVSVQAMRRALQRAEEFLDQEHPFTTARFKTDGRRVFLEVADETGEQKLVDLIRYQYGFHQVIAPSFKNVDFEADAMVRWWPMGRRHSIVLDPQRSFGAPINARSGVSTATIADVARTEGSASAVTLWFPVSVREVNDAVEFEHWLASAPTRGKLAA